jgi:hypothetical protein
LKVKGLRKEVPADVMLEFDAFNSAATGKELKGAPVGEVAASPPVVGSNWERIESRKKVEGSTMIIGSPTSFAQQLGKN